MIVFYSRKYFFFFLLYLPLGWLEKNMPIGPITILTSPIGKNGWYHEGVINSLIRGLKKNNVLFNFNPLIVEDINKTVIVVASVEALREAIELKKKGQITYLVAGPNVLSSAHDGNDIIMNSCLDYYLNPSKWVNDYFEDRIPETKNKNKVWFAGIDESFWIPSNTVKNKKTALLYWKTESEDFIKQITNIAKKNNWEIIIIKYGNYTKKEYKKALELSSFAIFISKSESQGIALAESWGMDVPTFVWNPKKPFVWLNETFTHVSSCPYLTDSTGKEWKTLDQLDILLDTFNTSEFSPRKWILENMTDAISVRKLVQIIESLYAEN